MLTRRLMAASAAAVLACLLAAVPAQAADGGGQCGGPDCDVWGGLPGTPGGGNPGGGGGTPGGGSGGGGSGCQFQGKTVPCSIGELGFFNPANGCYYAISPPPPGAEPKDGEEGNWYTIVCGMYDGGPVRTGNVWVPGAPLQEPPDPEELARRALASITLKGAEIGMAPQTNGAGLVNLPVWMWTTVTPNTWGPISASASEAGLTVTITAKAQRIVWDMGDGRTVTCANPGTPFTAGRGGTPSPTCGHVYREASRGRAGSTYPVTATTYWRVDWAGGGVTGVIDQTRTASTTVQIDELQVVNR